MIKNIFFDLDQTLLDFNLDEFLDLYMKLVYKRFLDNNLDASKLTKKINIAINDVINNDGLNTNEEVFFKTFLKDTNYDITYMKDLFNKFYDEDFIKLKSLTKPFKYTKLYVSILKEKGYNLFLTTNPVFPYKALKQRIEWANLNEEDFTYITTFENSSYAKPNPKYFLDVLNKFNLKSSETILIGNDVSDDLGCLKVGIKSFIKTDSIINKDNIDYVSTYQGDEEELLDFIKNL